MLAIFWLVLFGIIYAVLSVWGILGLVNLVILAGLALFIHDVFQKIKGNLEYEANRRREEEAFQKRMEEDRKVREARERSRAREFTEAVNSGVDVCWTCRRVRPKRCKCGKCIESGCGYFTWSSLECEKCYWERRRREYREARDLGLDVCSGCLTVQPDRCDEGHCLACVGQCYCGNCIACHGSAGGNECSTCG